MQDILFAPITINGLQVRNRIFMPAMHLNMCRNYQVTERLVDFYAERARGGAGMITAGYAAVDELAANPMHIGAHRDDLIPGLARLAAAIREHGACASLQLNHAGRYNHSFLLGGAQPVAPSAVPSRLTGETPRELSTAEIEAVIASFAGAAGRTRAAGFDAVEILAGTGYLISAFLSPVTNRRTDGYGGSPENRMRFGLEVVQAVRSAVGADFPLLVRLNGNDLMPGGVGREVLQQFAELLAAAGVDALNVNVGWHEAPVPQIVTKVPRGAFAYLARGIRERTAIPVIAGHRINDPAVARQLIEDGWCDLAAMGRALIADPELPEKARTGRAGEIVHCVACGQGCFDNLFRMQAVACLCNPRAGRERETAPAGAERPKKIVVVGGGAAGMSAAIAAADRGHLVTLVEEGGRLGGQLHLAGAPPGRGEFASLAQDLAVQVAQRGVRVVLHTRADREFIAAEQPEAVVLATGGCPAVPPIPGADLPHVVQAWDVLAKKVQTGRRVVVIGGGAVGVETALALAEAGTLSGEALKFLLVYGIETPEKLVELATRGTKQVVLVEMLEDLGRNFGKTTRWGMLQDLHRCGIQTRTGIRVQEISPEGVRVEKDGSADMLPADTVVLAVGTRAHHPLQAILEQLGVPYQVAGDAAGPGMAIDAIHQGFAAGREVL